jgi:hypothetical protein
MLEKQARIDKIGVWGVFKEDNAKLANSYGQMAADGKAYLSTLSPDSPEGENGFPVWYNANQDGTVHQNLKTMKKRERGDQDDDDDEQERRQNWAKRRKRNYTEYQKPDTIVSSWTAASSRERYRNRGKPHDYSSKVHHDPYPSPYNHDP